MKRKNSRSPTQGDERVQKTSRMPTAKREHSLYTTQAEVNNGMPIVKREHSLNTTQGDVNNSGMPAVKHKHEHSPSPTRSDTRITKQPPRRTHQHTHARSCATANPTDQDSPFRARGPTLQPKHFPKPLTCPFFATSGCNKTAAQCIYAHYDTGLVAQAPAPVPGRGTRAGRGLGVLLEREARAADERRRARQGALQKVETVAALLAPRFEFPRAEDTQGERHDWLVGVHIGGWERGAILKMLGEVAQLVKEM